MNSVAVIKTKEGQTIRCNPNTANKPCIPQDEFDTIESCKLCGKHF